MIRLDYIRDVSTWPHLTWLMQDDQGRRYTVQASLISASNRAYWAWPAHLTRAIDSEV